MLEINPNWKAITIAVTGHRDLIQQDISTVHALLKNKILELNTEFADASLEIITGDAEGADVLAIQIVHEINNPEISFTSLKQLVLPEKDPESKEILDDNYYDQQAQYIVDNAQVIITLWDGIFNHKKGGTSEVVRMALESPRDITIHHLICPRDCNLFPVSSLAKDAIDYESKTFNRIPFTISYTWVRHEKIKDNQKSPGEPNAVMKFGKDLVKRQLFWYFIIPVLLTFCTLILGYIGFRQIDSTNGETFGNNFFRAVNLITLNSSVIESSENGQPGILLHFARFTGLFTVVFAFIYALLLALKDVRESLIRLWWRNKDFVLVMGLSKKSVDLIKSLSIENTRIVVLTEQENYVFENELKQLRHLSVVRGSLSSATMLNAVYALKASKIFIMSDDDSKNVRAAQELDIMCKKQADSSIPQIFVHLLNDDYTNFLRPSLNKIQSQTCIFNIYENTVRRLFLHYPPDRFYQSVHSKTIKCFIIGFDEMSKEIVLTLLKQGHYETDKRLEITVYCKEAERAKESFFKQYPTLVTNKQDTPALQLIKAEVWENIQLNFLELPQSESQWLNSEQPLFTNINHTHIINVYAGLNDGIESAAYLNTLLPKLNSIQKETHCNVQVFCYYNFPDKKEEASIENYFNAHAPDIFVKCFGNFLDECSAATIQSMALDELAKLINSFYYYIDPFKEAITKKKPVDKWPFLEGNETEEKWSQCTVNHKISNQQASDHLWTKLRIIHALNQWNFDWNNFSLTENELKLLGEIEHRRWSAELLLQGLVPFDISTTSVEYKNIVNKWKDRAFKKEKQSQKLHINLVPFDQLIESEFDKDYNQIQAIPYFLRKSLSSAEHRGAEASTYSS